MKVFRFRLIQLNRFWLFSGKGLLIFFLAVLPLVLLLLINFSREYLVMHLYFDSEGNLQGPPDVLFTTYFLSGFQYAVFIAMFIAYPLCTHAYPYICRKYNKPYFKDIVIEFEYLKKILWIVIPLAFIFFYIFPIGISFVFGIEIPRPPWYHYIVPYIENISPYARSFGIWLLLMTGAGLVKMASSFTRKEFTLDYAKGCVQLLKQKKDEVEKMKYLRNSLSSYNKYIRKTLNVGINFYEIYSNIIRSPMNERKSSIQVVCTAFEGDKLDIISHLSTLSRDKEQFLTKDSFRNKIQLWGSDIGWLVSAIIGTLGAIVSVVTIFEP